MPLAVFFVLYCQLRFEESMKQSDQQHDMLDMQQSATPYNRVMLTI